MSVPQTVELKSSPSILREMVRSVASSVGPRSATPPAYTLRLAHVATDPARYRAYERVCHFPASETLRPTWIHVLSFPLQMRLLAGRDAPFPLAGLIHTHNAMTLHRAVPASTALDVSCRIDGTRAHKRGVLLDVACEAHVAGGHLVWEGMSTYLVRGGSVPGMGEPEEAEHLPDVAAEPVGKWQLPTDLGRQYASASGDRNPIHLSALTAKLFGFKRAIIHGMWTHARALAALEPRVPESYRVEVAWTKPILLPRTVRFAAEPRGDGWGFAVSSGFGEKASTHMVGQLAQL